MSGSTPFHVVGEHADGEASVFTLAVPEDCPFFEGHFPGRPVLPAIGQLAILTALVRRVAGAPVSLTGVDGLKLSRQVLPGDRVEIRLQSPMPGGKMAFSIRRDGDLISRGTLRFAEEPRG